MEQAIRDSLDCYRVCIETITYCLKKGGRLTEPDHVSILTDCAEVCNLNATFIIRDSIYQGRTAQLCADICEKCAISCETIDPMDVELITCAEICRKCAKSCRQMEERTEA